MLTSCCETREHPLHLDLDRILQKLQARKVAVEQLIRELENNSDRRAPSRHSSKACKSPVNLRRAV